MLLTSFNPRTRVGCDVYRDAAKRGEDMFQPTHPRGVRLAPRGSARRTRASFNPRTRVGCDHITVQTVVQVDGFNPRTRVGCDQFDLPVLRGLLRVSIHAPAWGATGGFRVRPVGPLAVSIHAPAWGATCAALSVSHRT